ncbi:hypothetical protein [Spongiibacter marinus]|uniref:hypothetical protein n=1 Tax=Spongiibacter marinus TaxID=354246 RepID=UPI00041877B5|nr:hypothetical protein [Spongiibacter marinus]
MNIERTTTTPTIEQLSSPFGIAFHLTTGRSFALTLCQQLTRIQVLHASQGRQWTADPATFLDWIELNPRDTPHLAFRYTGYSQAELATFINGLLLPERLELEKLLMSDQVSAFFNDAASHRERVRDNVVLALKPVEVPFYSHLEKWVKEQKFPQRQHQWSAQIEKAPGIKDDDKYWSGIKAQLRRYNPKTAIDPSELAEGLDWNPVKPRVYCAMLGCNDELSDFIAIDRELTAKEARAIRHDYMPAKACLIHPSYNYLIIRSEQGNLFNSSPTWIALDAEQNLITSSRDANPFRRSLSDLLAVVRNYHFVRHSWRGRPLPSSSYGEDSRQGGFNIREWLITLDNFPKRYTVGKHYMVVNLLFHLRTTEHICTKGNHLLFVEEIQSDWMQSRDPDHCNYRDQYHTRRMPWLTDWHQLGVNLAFYLAAHLGFDGVCMATGRHQVERFGVLSMKGLYDLYDKIIPRHCKLIARTWGLQVERHLLPIHHQRSTICKYSSGYTVIDNNAHPMTPPLNKNHARSYRIEREKIKSEEVPTYMLNPAIRAHLLERGIPIFGVLK